MPIASHCRCHHNYCRRVRLGTGVRGLKSRPALGRRIGRRIRRRSRTSRANVRSWPAAADTGGTRTTPGGQPTRCSHGRPLRSLATESSPPGTAGTAPCPSPRPHAPADRHRSGREVCALSAPLMLLLPSRQPRSPPWSPPWPRRPRDLPTDWTTESTVYVVVDLLCVLSLEPARVVHIWLRRRLL